MAASQRRAPNSALANEFGIVDVCDSDSRDSCDRLRQLFETVSQMSQLSLSQISGIRIEGDRVPTNAFEHASSAGILIWRFEGPGYFGYSC